MTRRTALGLGARGLGLGAVAALAGCAGASTSGTGGRDAVTFLSTQFTPVEERQRFEKILKDKVAGVGVAYNPVEAGVFSTTITSQVGAGKVSVGLAGGLHGDLAPHAGELIDVDDLLATLADRQFDPKVLALAKLGGRSAKYVPWMQASYLLAVNKKALDFKPAGADPRTLTYDQLLLWARDGHKATGKPVLGIPAGPKGLYHRFFQGYLLPSFTGGQITTFRSERAEDAWAYMAELWADCAPASTNYDFMQEPLERGEVLMAWDHIARLIGAVRAKPDDWLLLPAPTGPEGLGYLLVVAGIGIPRGAPALDRSRAVITALTTMDTQAEVLRQNAFFPVVGSGTPAGLPPAVTAAATAIQAQRSAPNAILSLPPVGLGTRDGEVTQIFKDCFTEICLNRKPVRPTLDAQARKLDALLAEVNVPCWAPDTGRSCRVG
jgi:multiple sugar transport system substrate-binding protein